MPLAENLNPPVLLTKEHDRISFDCSVPALNEFSKSTHCRIKRRTRLEPMLQRAGIE